MKVLPFKIPKTGQSSFHIQVDEEPYFYDTLHQHPEIQLTLIAQSSGSLIHGDYLGTFGPGDIFLIGPNVPHVFRNDKRFYEEHTPGAARALTLFFDLHTFGKPFLELPEARSLADFMQLAKQGMRVKPEAGEPIADLIRQVFQCMGMDRLILLLQILNLLSDPARYDLLTSSLQTKRMNEVEGKRLNDIFNFTMKEYGRAIRLEEVASLAHMSPSAFCRYFKQHTRKTYLDFLNEYRISQACRLLLETDKPISQVCYESGFNNLSNFNRKFKQLKQKTPREFVGEQRGI